ncbi:hypothetical protein [Chryseobacterium sp. JK1]|uniref:hypothetical protein n=1 Tax=Chryseobacterium sp. JK1 TaxID=874294 RepID=UPI003D694EB2
MKKIILIILMNLCHFAFGQSLNNTITFEKQSVEDSLQIERINKLIPLSKFMIEEDCNYIGFSRDWCIKSYIIVYLYNNEPILVDQKEFSTIRAYLTDGSESSSSYVTKSRTYIVDWNNKKYIGKKVILNQNGTKAEYPSDFNRSFIEYIINRNKR